MKLNSEFVFPNPESRTGKTLILALGNPILCDDAVGWEIADRLAAMLPKKSFGIVKESGATLDLLPKLQGYDQLIVVDAIRLGNVPVGSIHKLTLTDLDSTIRHSSAHDINFATAFSMAEELGCDLPPDILIYAVEVKELRRFSEDCTAEVAGLVDSIALYICHELLGGSAVAQKGL